MTVTEALQRLCPGAQFMSQITDDPEADYAATEWFDEREMPTLAEVLAELEIMDQEDPVEEIVVDPKQSALDKLTSMGLTEEEIQALFS